MRKTIWAFLLCLVATLSHAATLRGYGDVERCWDASCTTYTKWCVNCGGTMVSGESFIAQEGGEFGDVSESLTPATEETEGYCWCRMTSPYTGMYVFAANVSYVPSVMRLTECNTVFCADLWIGENCKESGYDEDCATEEGVGRFSNEAEQELFLSALFSTPQTPCEIGISRMMVSTGDAFSLWAEKYTDHALVVQYNDEKCYVKLESGAGKLNINFNGEIYHAVD